MKSKLYYIYFFLVASIVVSFQNCSKVMHQEIQFSKFNPNLPDPGDCMFNGQVVKQGSSVDAFLNSNVSFGQNCQSEKRTCQYGELQGSFSYGVCQVGGVSSCLFDGKTIPHGSSVESYLNSSVPFGSTCKSESRTCNNGVLSGANQYASCGVEVAESCLFDGKTIPHGGSVKAYQQSSVPAGSSCVTQNRTCNDGVLSGTNQFANCGVDVAKSCSFDGVTIPHGGSVNAFQQSSVPAGSSCVAQDRVCNDGLLSGTNQFSTCSVNAAKSCLYNETTTIPHGGSVKAYQQSSVPAGSSCVTQDRTCSDGTLSGSYTKNTCLVESPLGLLTSSSCRDKKNPIIITQNKTLNVRSDAEYFASNDSNYLIQGSNLTVNIDSMYMSCIEIVGDNNVLNVTDEYQPSIGTQIKVLGKSNNLVLNPENLQVTGAHNTVKLKSNYHYSDSTKDVVVGASIKIDGDYATVEYLSETINVNIDIKGNFFTLSNNGLFVSYTTRLGDMISVVGNNGQILFTDPDPSNITISWTRIKIDGAYNNVRLENFWSGSLTVYGLMNNIIYNGVDFSNQTNVVFSSPYNYAPTTTIAPPK